MSKHKFTADRSDMAHRIKQQLRSSTAIQPPPMEELPRSRWGESGEPVFVKPSQCGMTEIMSRAFGSLIMNGEVTIVSRLCSDRNCPEAETSHSRDYCERRHPIRK